MKKIKTYQISIDYKSLDENYKLSQSSIKCKELEGNWLCGSPGKSYTLREEDYIKLGIISPIFYDESIISNNKTVLLNKNIYRYPKLDLPRQKVDLLKEKYNCKVIRDLDKADIHIVSLKFINSLISSRWGGSWPFSEAFKLFKFMKESNICSQLCLENIQILINKMPHDSRIKFNFHYNYNSYQQNGNKLSQNASTAVSSFIDSMEFKQPNQDYFVLDENLPIFNNIIKNNAITTSDASICNIIDSDLVVIKDDEYDSISEMIKSDNVENRSLVLEMLSNCNLNKSFNVVSSLYYWNWSKLKESSNWNTINVKTFKKRMQDYAGDHPTYNVYSFNNYIKLLKADNKVTQFAIDKTKSLFYKTILNKTLGDESEVFKIKLNEIEITDELQSCIRINKSIIK